MFDTVWCDSEIAILQLRKATASTIHFLSSRKERQLDIHQCRENLLEQTSSVDCVVKQQMYSNHSVFLSTVSFSPNATRSEIRLYSLVFTLQFENAARVFDVCPSRCPRRSNRWLLSASRTSV